MLNAVACGLLQATEVIQSAMRGHLARKRNMDHLSERSRGYHAGMDREVNLMLFVVNGCSPCLSL